MNKDSKRKTADDLAGKMMAAQLKPVSIQKSRGLYKVWIGPYASEREIEASMRRVRKLNGLLGSIILTDT